MREVGASRQIGAPRQAVWDVLADFPNIADWNGGVKKSYATGDEADGIGASRHCDLKPTGGVDETIREWEPTDRLVISIDSTKRVPMKSGLATFTLAGEADGPVDVEVQFHYTPRFGAIGNLFGKMLDKQFTKAMAGVLDDLDVAATERSTT